MSEPTQEADWTLRPARPEDNAFLEKLFCQVHTSDFAGVSLPEQQVLGLLQMQARAQRLGYLRDFPSAQGRIVMAGAGAIGRLLVEYRDDAMHLVDIALLPEWQGRGIGTGILQDLQTEARERAVPLQLVVRPGNPALQLYIRLGFVITTGGLQLRMEWNPNGEREPIQPVGSRNCTAPAVASTDLAEDLAAEYARIAGRRFRVDGAGLELTLEKVRRYPAFGTASFSLFFLGPLEPILPQGTYVLRLLQDNGESEQEFAIFLVPLGPEGNRMQYEAVFNL